MAFELPFRVKFPRASEGGGTIATKDFVEASTEAIKLFGENPNNVESDDTEMTMKVLLQIC